MPSLRDGDYRMVGAIQGSSPDRWYRQLLDAHQPRRADGAFRLSCDCPAWIKGSLARSCTQSDSSPGRRSIRPTGLATLRPIG